MAEIDKIHHVAMVVENLEEALSFWRDALGLRLSEVCEVPSEDARVAFFPLGETKIELVEPQSRESGLGRFLQKRGAGMHHICLQVNDLAATLARLNQKGIELINPTPVVADDGRQYAFIHPKSAYGVLIELYQLPEQHDSRFP